MQKMRFRRWPKRFLGYVATVDGSAILHHLRDVENPVKNGIFTILTGAGFQPLLRLMVQKSGILQLRLVVYPIIYKVLYIPGG